MTLPQNVVLIARNIPIGSHACSLTLAFWQSGSLVPGTVVVASHPVLLKGLVRVVGRLAELLSHSAVVGDDGARHQRLGRVERVELGLGDVVGVGADDVEYAHLSVGQGLVEDLDLVDLALADLEVVKAAVDDAEAGALDGHEAVVCLQNYHE